MIEKEGYIPESLEDSIDLAKILKKVSREKMSIEAGLKEILNGIKSGKLRFKQPTSKATS